jgi:NTE family protein
MALAAPTGDEATYLARFGRRLTAQTWPASPRLVITAVDAASGEAVAWDAAAGVPLVRAVAASCAVPCVFPPVAIGGRRYMDGGVRSLINADLAAGSAPVVVIAPLAAFATSWARERAALGKARSLLIEPAAAALEAIGPNVLDPSRRRAAWDAGLAQGPALADEVRAVWG